MKLLVCVDLSESTEIIVKKIEEITKALPAKVWLLHNAVPEPDVVEFKVDPQAARESLAKKFHVEHRQIQELAKRMRKAGVDTTALLVHGATVEIILGHAWSPVPNEKRGGDDGARVVFLVGPGRLAHTVERLVKRFARE